MGSRKISDQYQVWVKDNLYVGFKEYTFDDIGFRYEYGFIFGKGDREGYIQKLFDGIAKKR